MSTPVPAEHELIEVSGQMGLAQAVVHAESPGFEISEDAVDPAQDLMGLCRPDDFGFVPVVGHAFVSHPPVGDHPGSGRGGLRQEDTQRGGREIGDRWPEGDLDVVVFYFMVGYLICFIVYNN